MIYRIVIAGALALAVVGCKTGAGAEAAAKREADRQAMRMEDLEKQRNALKTKVEQLQQENAQLRQQRDELQARLNGAK